MTKKTYLRAPNLDYEPDKAIRLGQIWSNPEDPGSFCGSLLPFPEEMPTNHSYKREWTSGNGRERQGSIGIWTKFLQVVGVQAEGSVTWNTADDVNYTIPLLDTYSIEPTAAYVKESTETTETDLIRRGESLYMITGVKIARGAAETVSASNGFGVKGKVGLNATPVAAPVAGGPQVDVTRGKHSMHGFKESSDIVFAYRVREIFYEKGLIKTREYNKGALYGDGMVSHDNKEDSLTFGIKNAELGSEDVSIPGEVFTFIDDDGEESGFIV